MFLLLCFIQSALALTCPKYSCPSDETEFPINGCSLKESDHYWVQPCTDALKNVCDVSNPSNGTCQTPTVTPKVKYPGEKCSSINDCSFSKACKEGVCIGSSINETCSDSRFCDRGLFCSNNTCQKLLTTNCTNDYQCENHLTCAGGKCVKYFSIGANENSGQCAYGLNLACKSSMCTSIGGNKCLDFIEHEGKMPRNCTENSDCKSKPFGPMNDTINSQCGCGMNPKGTAYCSLLPGDKVYKFHLEVTKKWLNSEEVKKCHTMRRMAYDCISDWWDTKNTVYFYYYKETLLNYQKLQNMDNCTKLVFFKDYAAAEDKYNKVGDIVGKAGLLVLSSLLVLAYV